MNLFSMILEGRIPMGGHLRQIYHKLALNKLSSLQTPIATFRITQHPSSSNLVIIRRADFEDLLGKIPRAEDKNLLEP